MTHENARTLRLPQVPSIALGGLGCGLLAFGAFLGFLAVAVFPYDEGNPEGSDTSLLVVFAVCIVVAGIGFWAAVLRRWFKDDQPPPNKVLEQMKPRHASNDTAA